jgi:hypothetical protein
MFPLLSHSLLSLFIAQDLPAPPASAPPATRLDWAWLADTYWIVPTADLPAMQMDPKDDAVTWIVDQTVWHLQGYRTGYVWGTGVAMLRAPTPESPGPGEAETTQCLTILGTITPDGAVHLTFVPTVARRSTLATVGTGRIWTQWTPSVSTPGPVAPQPAFEMQMSTGDRARTAHWAHMVQVKEGEPAWSALPGFTVGVEEPLEGCKAVTGPSL